MVFHSAREALIALGVSGVLLVIFLGLFWLAVIVPAFATWVVAAELAVLLALTVISRVRRRRPRPTHTTGTWI